MSFSSLETTPVCTRCVLRAGHWGLASRCVPSAPGSAPSVSPGPRWLRPPPEGSTASAQPFSGTHPGVVSSPPAAPRALRKGSGHHFLPPSFLKSRLPVHRRVQELGAWNREASPCVREMCGHLHCLRPLLQGATRVAKVPSWKRGLAPHCPGAGPSSCRYCQFRSEGYKL